MADEIVVVCKECGKKLKTDKKFLGRKGRCPHCGAAIRIAPGGEGKEGGAEQVVTFGEVETLKARGGRRLDEVFFDAIAGVGHENEPDNDNL